MTLVAGQLGHRAELIEVGTDVGHLMHNDQMVLRIDRCLHVVAHDSRARVIMERLSGSVSETCLSDDSFHRQSCVITSGNRSNAERLLVYSDARKKC